VDPAEARSLHPDVTGTVDARGHHDGQGGAHAGAGPRTYLVIAAFLVMLTVMEIVVFYIPALAGVLVPLLVFLAVAKFVLVAMFYMHLKFDDAWFSYLFVFPLVIMVGMAVYLLWLFGHFGTTGIRPT
jgi:cytochrome c oxidase subunit 4